MSAPDSADDIPIRPARPANRVVGPFDAFHIMTERDAQRADEALSRLLRADDTEHAMVDELNAAKPLAHPLAFDAAHRTFVRALEVYDRNGRRKPTGLPAGPLRPIVSPVVGLLSRTIMRMYLKRMLGDARRLYVMREANSPVGSAEHRVLGTARRQLDQILPSLTGQGFVIPAFLLGGAVLSAVASVISDLVHSVGRLTLLVVILVVTIGAFWCIVMAAAVTRRRTMLVIDQPLNALWRTIGGVGILPHDPSRAFVAVATTLLILGWIIVPVIAALVGQFL